MWEVGIKAMRWELGDGRNVSFWKDIWVEEENPLLSYVTTPILPMDFNLKVRDYVDREGRWKITTLCNHLPDEIVRKIMAIPVPNDNQGHDRLGWRGSKTGKFSTAEAYSYIARGRWQPKEEKWMSIWRWKGPERVKTFLWLLMRGALLTKQELRRRHITDQTGCHLCGRIESSWHVMRDCYRSQQVWKRIKIDLPTVFWVEQDMETWLERNLKMDDEENGIPWTLWFGITCWMLWRIRNEEEFAGKPTRGTEIFHNIHAMARQTHWANGNFGGGKNGSQQEGVKEWRPPPPNWIKMNSDGSVMERTGQATVGGCIRNEKGEWISGFACYVGYCTPIEAEIWGVIHGLELAWKMGYRRIILETDAKEVADLLVEEDTGEFSTLIKKARGLVHRNWEIEVKQISRNQNRLADGMAKVGYTKLYGLKIFEVPPHEVQMIFWNEFLGMLSQR